MLMSTNVPFIYYRDRVCPGCKQFKTADNFNSFTIRCRECCAKYYQQNKQRALKNNKNYREANKQHRKMYAENYYLNKKLGIKKQNKQKRKISEYRNYVNQYNKKRYYTDIKFRLKYVWSGRIHKYLIRRQMPKKFSITELFGNTLDKVLAHIEHQFQPGMTWENYGRYTWHIDHIIPCSKFDLTDPEQVKQCFHYTNLQPLWAADNLKKSNKIST
jgi:hypothetical protein